MENFAKPSVLKNHIKSYSSANKAVQDDLEKRMDNLVKNQSEYNKIADRISNYSKNRESVIKSLERKFNEYSLDFQHPLISNDLEDIIRYGNELESELNISLASLNGEERDKVTEDLRITSDEIEQLKTLSSSIEKESKKLIELEAELSIDGPREKDADEEKIINFNDLMNKKNEELEEEDDLVKIINDELNLDSINSSIFNEEESDDLSSELNDNKKDMDDVVKVKLNPGSSLVDKVDFVYGEGLIDNIYKFSNNKRVIDDKAKVLGITPNEAMNDDNALSGVVIDFPTELDLNRTQDNDLIDFPTDLDLYENDEEDIKRLG